MNPFPLPNNYRIFLLTVWRDGSSTAESGDLRFSLHDPRSGLRRGFAEPEKLLAFLEESAGITEEGDPKSPG